MLKKFLVIQQSEIFKYHENKSFKLQLTHISDAFFILITIFVKLHAVGQIKIIVS